MGRRRWGAGGWRQGSLSRRNTAPAPSGAPLSARPSQPPRIGCRGSARARWGTRAGVRARGERGAALHCRGVCPSRLPSARARAAGTHSASPGRLRASAATVWRLRSVSEQSTRPGKSPRSAKSGASAAAAASPPGVSARWWSGTPAAAEASSDSPWRSSSSVRRRCVDADAEGGGCADEADAAAAARADAARAAAGGRARGREASIREPLCSLLPSTALQPRTVFKAEGTHRRAGGCSTQRGRDPAGARAGEGTSGLSEET